jgi:hypothetical protein
MKRGQRLFYLVGVMLILAVQNLQVQAVESTDMRASGGRRRWGRGS